MVDYGFEMEQLAEQCRRISAGISEELEEINRRAAARSQALVERTRADIDQFMDEHGEEFLKQLAESQEQERREAEERAERERREAEEREQREAVARAIAARKSKNVVTPIDEDDDPEGEYYRRQSWLV